MLDMDASGLYGPRPLGQSRAYRGLHAHDLAAADVGGTRTGPNRANSTAWTSATVHRVTHP